MVKNLKHELLNTLGKVYESSEKCKLSQTFFDEVDSELKILSKYFKVTKPQALIIAVVFVLNYKGDTVDLKDLIEYFDCNPMKILEFSDDFNELNSRGIFNKEKSRHRVNVTLSNNQYTINKIITEAILKNNPMPEIEKEEPKDIVDVLEKLYELSEQRNNTEISTSDLYVMSINQILSNLHFPLIKEINNLTFNIDDTLIYIYLIWKTLLGKDSVDVERLTESIFDNAAKKVNYLQSIMSNNNHLLNNNYVEIVETTFLNDIEFKLSEYSVEMLKDFGLNIHTNKKKKNNIIEPSKIINKELYFNEKEGKQIEMLQTIFNNDNYIKTQNQLKNKGLPQGITALLHGLPGTGKTELVYQIAKKTNREIVKVDISQSKSMWYGESEKIVKKIFTDYRAYSKKCSQVPILLFNEADALISKRKDSAFSSVDQTENTIQNILLEELENFEGLFVATTNLVKNLDSAFERRFLFKIEFQKPIISVKAKIWNLKMPNLTIDECEILAEKFDFSGGQIENIVRKNEINEIIGGIKVDFSKILEFCNAESLKTENKIKIGYKKN